MPNGCQPLTILSILVQCDIINSVNIQIDTKTLLDEKSELTTFLAQPNAFSDPDFAGKTRRLNEIETITSKYSELQTAQKQLIEADVIENHTIKDY